MSSKRGRKRNDNLPPNRARDVQRAFRARRAAHLDALEQRVAELEEENNTLRAALQLPPANRPALGKGPTGKDKPKPYAPRQTPVMSSAEPVASGSSLPGGVQHIPSHMPMPSSSRTESPSSTSTRTHSLSPSSIAAVLNPAASQAQVSIETRAWEDGIFAGRAECAEVQPSPISSSYPATPVSAAASQNHFPYSAAPSSRAPMGEQPSYPLSITQNYPHNADRPMGDVYADAMFERRYYSQPTFTTSHDASHSQQIHAQSPTTAAPPIPPQRGNAPINYAHRRPITEPQALRDVMYSVQQQMPHSGQHGMSQTRGPSPTGMSDGVGHLRAAEFNLNSRVGRMSSLPSS